MADQYTRRALQALLGLTAVYTLYPVVGAGAIPGVTVTTAAGSWGADATIIAAAAIPGEFWVCSADVDTVAGGAIQPFVIELEIAGTTSIFAFRFDPTATTTNIGRFRVPYPRYIPAGSQITARASGAAIRTINVSVLVATGL